MFYFGHDFYRNEAHKHAHSDIHEPKGPVVVYVDVLHVTEEAALGVEDAPLA
ncbi:MAG TPA: hypothetical protein VHM69_06720 [Rubrobacter sp.]|nr:hypothetical protein [Rubrobacter sp.]